MAYVHFFFDWLYILLWIILLQPYLLISRHEPNIHIHKSTFFGPPAALQWSEQQQAGQQHFGQTTKTLTNQTIKLSLRTFSFFVHRTLNFSLECINSGPRAFFSCEEPSEFVAVKDFGQ